jgi:hypothetical protein
MIRAAAQTDGPQWCSVSRGIPSSPKLIYVALDRYPSNLVFTPEQAAERKPSATFCYGRH